MSKHVGAHAVGTQADGREGKGKKGRELAGVASPLIGLMLELEVGVGSEKEQQRDNIRRRKLEELGWKLRSKHAVVLDRQLATKQ